MCLVFAAVCGLSLVAESKGFSCCGIQAPEHRLSSCGAWAYLLCGMWHLPWPRYEPMTPASAGRLSTTGPQGKSRKSRFLIAYFFVFSFFMESFNWESPGFLFSFILTTFHTYGQTHSLEFLFLLYMCVSSIFFMETTKITSRYSLCNVLEDIKWVF